MWRRSSVAAEHEGGCQGGPMSVVLRGEPEEEASTASWRQALLCKGLQVCNQAW